MLALALYIFSLIIVLGYTTIIFFLAQFKKDNSIIDIAYGLGFIITGLFLTHSNLLQHSKLSLYSIIILTLIIIWGTRLSYRIYKKNKGKDEDFRYKTWREDWNKKGYLYYFSRSYLQIFILQGFIISLVLLPFTLSLSTSQVSTSGILFGLALWAIGFFFEAVGDRQLDKFIKHKHTTGHTIMKTGLWKYTRHPNYFGESMMWFGLGYIAYVATGSLFVFISPILITYLLLFVSGIPMLEKKWEGNEEWEAYKKKTSAFIPLPQKN